MNDNIRPMIVGNWKMNSTLIEAVELAATLDQASTRFNNVDIGIAPPLIWLEPISRTLTPDRIYLGAQDCSRWQNGAHTGEVSAAMIAELASFVIVGHSEKRASGDTNEIVRNKMVQALDHGLRVLLCVGEDAANRQSGMAEEFVEQQLQHALQDLTPRQLLQIDIAYEPIWAIGTGQVATAEDIAPMMKRIADVGANLTNVSFSSRTLYGGSASPDNARELLGVPGVDGLLVGGASLKSSAFLDIIEAAETRTRHSGH